MALTSQQIERIVAFKEILGDVDSSTLEKAISDFGLDDDPDAEIKIFEQMAARFKQLVKDDMDLEERKMIFGKILLRSMNEDPIQIRREE